MKTILSSLRKLIFGFMFFFCTSFNTHYTEMALYIRNTGDETINVAKADGRYKGGAWEIEYSGWFSVNPGERRYIGSIYWESSIVSLAFAKGDGYVLYDFETDSDEKRKADTIYVDPEHSFKYTGRAPSNYKPIETSLKIRMKNNGGINDIHYQTIQIPSFKTDKVITTKAAANVVSNSPKNKKTAATLREKKDTSLRLAPVGTYKKGGIYIKDIDIRAGTYYIMSYIQYTDTKVKAGEFLSIEVSALPMMSEYYKRPPDHLAEYELGDRVANAPDGALYARIGKGPWKLVGKGGELKATSDGELQFMVNETKRDKNSIMYVVNVTHFEN